MFERATDNRNKNKEATPNTNINAANLRDDGRTWNFRQLKIQEAVTASGKVC